MPSEDDAAARLQAALAQLAGEDAAALIEEARADARARVRAELADTWERAMRSAVERTLSGGDPAPAPSVDVAAPRAPHGDGGTLVYVYGVIDADAQLGDLSSGVGGQPPRALIECDLAAIVGDVPARDFDEEQLRAHLADMTWVETAARRHEDVLDAIRAAATVVPMRMCSVYSSEQGVRALLTREASALHEALRTLDGKTEWGVKVFHHRSAAASQTDAPPPASGAQYMQGRVRERQAQADATGRIQDAVAQIHETLHAMATDSVILAPQRPEVSGRSAQMVLNGVYLVPDDAAGAFRERTQALGAEFRETLGLGVELTGPWPAYNFVPGTIGTGW